MWSGYEDEAKPTAACSFQFFFAFTIVEPYSFHLHPTQLL